MSDKIETIDSSRMEILSEFAVPDEDGVTIPYRIGVLDGKFILASQSGIAQKPQGKVVPENVDARTKTVFERGIERGWWSGDIAFGLENFDAVLERLEEIYAARPSRSIDLNDFDIKNGGDTGSVRMNSIAPHNVAAPIVSLQLTNYRLMNLDGVEKEGWHRYLSPQTGEKLMIEMQKIQPLVRAKSQMSG